jgi:hypothetical protein
MPILHIDKLRSGERTEDEYQVVETTSLPPWNAEASRAVVGHPYPRVEGVEKVTGNSQGCFTPVSCAARCRMRAFAASTPLAPRHCPVCGPC